MMVKISHSSNYLTPAEKFRAEGAMNALEIAGIRIRELEAAHTKEVMLHAVTKFELEQCRAALREAFFLAAKCRIPGAEEFGRWEKLI